MSGARSTADAHRLLGSNVMHTISRLVNMERVAQMRSSRPIPRLCQETYRAGPPHLITMTISEKKQGCLQALRSTNKLATRVAHVTSMWDSYIRYLHST
ncbi:hypothetical protein GGH13_000812 [Coemansia sp. S155-1]|nr:hypothetical protein GGH13_000812 [Coemansia sp. S155-1]